MALSPAAAELTRAYNDESAARAAVLAALVIRWFDRLIDPNNLIETSKDWLDIVLDLIFDERRRLASFAAEYFRTFRILELAAVVGVDPAIAIDEGMFLDFDPEPFLDPEVDPYVFYDLRDDGPAALADRLQKNMALPEALEKSAADAAGAAVRHALNAGRDTIERNQKNDPRCIGYMRYSTNPDRCYFCAMLISRGPVYLDESFEASDPRFIGEGEHKVHNHCKCSLEPIYSREGDVMYDDGLALYDAWREATQGVSPSRKLNAWRNWYAKHSAELLAPV